eukprot:6277109-Lingulodinium_polyedra.AAC.1
MCCASRPPALRSPWRTAAPAAARAAASGRLDIVQSCCLQFIVVGVIVGRRVVWCRELKNPAGASRVGL